MCDIYDFIEKYYPNYHSSDIIALESDLNMIIKNEIPYNKVKDLDKLRDNYDSILDIVNHHTFLERNILKDSINNYLKIKNHVGTM